jgi:hypothetical protein
LRLLAAVRWSIRENGVKPSSRQVEEPLDERLSHRRCGPTVPLVGRVVVVGWRSRRWTTLSRSTRGVLQELTKA